MSTGSRATRRRRTLALPFPTLLAARYLRSTRRDAFVTLLAGLSAFGIAIGTAALVLVLSALSGLQRFLRDDVLARTPHIEISGPALADAAVAAPLVAELRAIDGIRSVDRVMRGRGWVILGGGVRAVEITGFDGAIPAFFPGAERRGADRDEPGLWLGTTQEATWGVLPGEALELVSPRPTLSPFGPVPRTARVPFVGVFASGRTEQPGSARLAVPLATSERLFGRSGVKLVLTADSLERALAVRASVSAALPADLTLATWSDLNRPLFFALRLEKSVMFLSVFLVVPVAALALVTALALLVAAKRSEIGMLRAMGATARDLRRAFATLGLAVGLAGIVVGISAGGLGAWLADRFRLVSPPGNVYFVEYLPFATSATDLGVIFLAAMTMCLLATLWAARRAAAIEPVEAIRR